jgi:hypothetical protein
MGYQNISAVVTPDEMQQVRDHFTALNNLFTFLVTLSADEKKSLVKLGPKSADFVADASSAATNFPSILPSSFNTLEYNRDTTLFGQLAEIKMLLDSFSEKINNTHSAVGSEAMDASLEVYAYVQTAKDRVPGLKSVAEKLRERFKNNGKSKKQGPSV